jgi:hypothetical protein
VGLEVSINGAATLHRVAAQMRTEANKPLAREMGKAIAKATEPVKVEIKAEAERVMPSEGGYRSLLTKSLRWRMSRRSAGQTAQVILATYADGTSERRDIVALERGSLRHPIWGRSRRIKVGNRAGTIIPNGWAVTTIRSGFHERGTASAMDAAQAALADVVQDYAGRLAGR